MRADTRKLVQVSRVGRGALFSWVRREFEGCCWKTGWFSVN